MSSIAAAKRPVGTTREAEVERLAMEDKYGFDIADVRQLAENVQEMI